MRTVWTLVFAAMMAYVAWWLIHAIRKRIVFEMEMALGVGSLWAAFLAPALFEGAPALVTWPSAVSLAGKALFWLSIVLFVTVIHSLHRGGKPAFGWEHTTERRRVGFTAWCVIPCNWVASWEPAPWLC